MDTTPKFQKGDKVVVLDMSYFDNPFHYKKCIHEYTVQDADEHYFSPFYEKYDRSMSGSNMWSIFKQSTGMAMYGSEQLYHKEKDAETIRVIIAAGLKKYDDFCASNDRSEIANLQQLIESSKSKIKSIESGDGYWKMGFSTYNNQSYRKQVTEIIEKVFPIE